MSATSDAPLEELIPSIAEHHDREREHGDDPAYGGKILNVGLVRCLGTERIMPQGE